MSKSQQKKVTLVRSLAKCLKNHKACVRGLGLRRMHHSVIVQVTPATLGMINQVSYLLKVEDV